MDNKWVQNKLHYAIAVDFMTFCLNLVQFRFTDSAPITSKLA